MFIRGLIVILILWIEGSYSRTILEFCPKLPENALTSILGSAYNPRYMSISEPTVITEPKVGNKRASPEEEFFLDGNFHEELGNQPAWEVKHITDINMKRKPRQVYIEENKNNKAHLNELKRDNRQVFLDSISPTKSNIFKSRPWECNARIRWLDLGYEYFPRYIRSVECTKKQCWYGHYTCKPRSFAIKVLRRRTGECARVSEKLLLATQDQISGEFTELWVWEEKAVNFCCDCVMI